jgi:hypothetical protein
MSHRVLAACLAALVAAAAHGQAFNLDFGQPDDVPPPSYAAAGGAGVWVGLVAPNTTTTPDLIDVDGDITDVSVRQLGGTATPTADDPSTLGEDSLLLDDHLVTFNEIETCLFFENVEPGVYEVLIYAWMPLQPAVRSYTSIDQEENNPHYEVGGVWTGRHQELVTYSRHVVTVATDGILNMHSGLAPGADPSLGAALNAVQIRPLAEIFDDGFESGDTSAWPTTVP